MVVSNGIFYAVNNWDSTVTIINTDSNTMLELSAALLSGTNQPINIAVTPDGNK